MDSKIAHDERINFADRLRTSLLDACQPVEPSAFMRAYNLRADGATVTSHAARKWLRGEAFPTQEKILIIARWLNVHASWLRFGDAEKRNYGAGPPPPLDESWSNENLVLMHDIRALTPVGQIIVRDLVDSLMRITVAERQSVVPDDLPMKKRHEKDHG